jgi:hypothetical protein
MEMSHLKRNIMGTLLYMRLIVDELSLQKYFH